MKTVIITISIVFLLLGLFIVLFILYYSKRQKENKEEKQLMKSRFESESLKAQIEIQEQTLHNISQEIHDNIGQSLSLVKLNLNILSDTIPTSTKLEDAKQLVGKVINDLRELSRSMHGEKIKELGLEESITRELKFLENSGKFNTTIDVAGIPYDLDPQKQIVLFRIVQEALNNCIKYSNARSIYVIFNYTKDAFILTVKDDGIGFNITDLDVSQTGVGLKNMQNRAYIIGGIFSLHSLHGEGTLITVTLPQS